MNAAWASTARFIPRVRATAEYECPRSRSATTSSSRFVRVRGKRGRDPRSSLSRSKPRRSRGRFPLEGIGDRNHGLGPLPKWVDRAARSQRPSRHCMGTERIGAKYTDANGSKAWLEGARPGWILRASPKNEPRSRAVPGQAGSALAIYVHTGVAWSGCASSRWRRTFRTL